MNYNKKFKLKLILSFKEGKTSISKIASKNYIPKQTLTRWIKLYEKSGEEELENKKPGIKEKPFDKETEKQILQLWKEGKRSKYAMRKDLKTKDINISVWKLQKIYKKYKLIY